MSEHLTAALAAAPPDDGCTLTNWQPCFETMTQSIGQAINSAGTSVGQAVQQSLDTAAGNALLDIAKNFSDGLIGMLQTYANWFDRMNYVDLGASNVSTISDISMGIGAAIAVLLLLTQVARTAFTHDGSPLAQGVTGVGKAALAAMMTWGVAQTALIASDDLTAWIIKQSFGGDGTTALRQKLTAMFAADILWDMPGAAALMIIICLVGIIVVICLWAEMLFRQAAVTILVATSPIAASGLVGRSTADWWRKLVNATAQLIILKPVIAMVFAIGLNMVGGKDINSLLAGLLTLVLAVFAWPAVARFFTFAGTGMGSGLVGSLMGTSINGGGGGAGGGAGDMSCTEATKALESGNMATVQSSLGSGASAGGASASGAGSGAAAAAGPVGAAVLAAGAVVKTAGQIKDMMHGQLSAMSDHAGLGPSSQPQYGQIDLPPHRGAPASTGIRSAVHQPYATRPPSPPAP